MLSDLKSIDSWKSIKTYLEINCPQRHHELFGEDECGVQTVHRDLGTVVKKWLHQKTDVEDSHTTGVRSSKVLANASLRAMNRDERRKIYRRWIMDITNTVRETLCRALDSYTKIRDMHNHCR